MTSTGERSYVAVALGEAALAEPGALGALDALDASDAAADAGAAALLLASLAALDALGFAPFARPLAVGDAPLAPGDGLSIGNA
jgi:hypothetical protein